MKATRNKTEKTAGGQILAEGEMSGAGYLDGQLLIAMPVMDDERFARSVIYLCAHSSEGAMGIIVNRPAGSIDFPQLLVQLDIINKADQIKLPGSAEEIQSFCSTAYGVTFPLFEKIDVNGDDRHPLYQQLTEVADAEGQAGDVSWNFEKFLISPDGTVAARLRQAGGSLEGALPA